MRSSATADLTYDRLITTDMSANIVKDLLKRKWSIHRIAETIDVRA